MTSNPESETGVTDDLQVSLVRGDAVFRLQRSVGLIPRNGFGLGRRALLIALITWLPIAVWAFARRRLFAGAVAEPLLEHFGIHIRCLIALPLLVLGEGVAHGVTMRLIPYFVRSGLVRETDRERFRNVVLGVARLRDSTLPWILIAGIVIAWAFLAPVILDAHEVVWATEEGGAPTLGFGGWWFIYVTRPVYIALLLAWGWRLGLLFVLLRRIAKIDLAIVPTHPDGAGGLGFLEGVPMAFSLVIFACSSVIASRWAHDVVYHGVHVDTLRFPAIGFVVTALVLFLAPLLVFAPVLGPAKRRALLDYGSLVGEHGRLVARRWIAREPVGDVALLSAPEIGPVADTISLYAAVAGMRPIPIGKRALMSIALPAALPLVVVFAIEVPIKELLVKLLSTLA